MTARGAPSILRAFLKSEATGGLLLMAAAALAMIVANSPLSTLYFDTLETRFGGMAVLHWINDGLMALFFLLVGLEIKREFLIGHLSSWPDRALPGLAALGGVVVPVLIYLVFNHDNPLAVRGWAVPAATDIAFALGILSLLGKRVPISLKLFLTTLAILDDLAAILIIAIFYTDHLAVGPLIGALGATASLVVLNRARVTNLLPYAVLGALLWFLVLKSGIHATVAGVVLAMTIPLRPPARAPRGTRTTLRQLEKWLSPWVSYLIVPLFSFANAGVSFGGMKPDILLEPVTLGIGLGLFLGKQIGVTGAAWLAIKAGLASLPPGASWRQFYGVAVLCGIGFTMSLFIGLLAFHGPGLQNEIKVGVLAGSLLSGLLGWGLFRLSARSIRPSPLPHAGEGDSPVGERGEGKL